MKNVTNNPVQQYLQQLPEDRKEAMKSLQNLMKTHLPKGFEEVLHNNMICYQVPLSTYPAGYHCTSGTALPFINIASQKNHIAIYHMGLYADKELLNWFVEEYPKHTKSKPDIGKSCIRFKKPEQIPYQAIALLAKKISVKDWIKMYEETFTSR